MGHVLSALVKGRAETVGASPAVFGLGLGHARRWRMIVANTHGSQTITAIRLRRRVWAGSHATPWVAVASGLPLAAGATMTFQPDVDDCSEELEVELTASGGGTTVVFDLAGAW